MRNIKKIIFPSLLSVMLGLTSCGGDNDSLADLIPINSSNAEALIEMVFVNTSRLSSFSAEGRSPSLREIIALTKQARTDNQDYKQITSSPVHTDNCSSGSYTLTSSKVGNTESGSLTFNDCVVGEVSLSGGWTYSDTYDNITKDYDESSSGSITASNSITGDVVSVNLNGLNFAKSGNRSDDTYIIREFSLALSVTAVGLSVTAFKVELMEPIVESNGDSCPESGRIKVSGGLGTFAELTYNGSSSSLTVNGVPVSTIGDCYI